MRWTRSRSPRAACSVPRRSMAMPRAASRPCSVVSGAPELADPRLPVPLRDVAGHEEEVAGLHGGDVDRSRRRGRRERDAGRAKSLVDGHDRSPVVERGMVSPGGSAMHAIRVSRTGDPSVLEYVSTDRPVPGKGEALVRIEASGRQLHRRLPPHRTLQAPAPLYPGLGRGGGGGGGRSRGRGAQGRRSRRLRDVDRLLRRARRRPGLEAGAGAAGRSPRARRPPSCSRA